MRQQLIAHPTTPSRAVAGIDVEIVHKSSTQMLLRFCLTGEMDTLLIPERVPPIRQDELWRRTCFELFIGAEGDAYYEFNFSPSTEWAAYRFESYRSGMTDVAAPRAPVIESSVRQSGFDLSASIDVAEMLILPANGDWRVGLSAIIEAGDGKKSYWALAHPPGKPDFHHADCFALQISTKDKS